MTRTVTKNYRMYIDGYDLSGVSRECGPFGIEHDTPELTSWTDTVKGYMKGHTQVNLGTYNALFDNTATTGLHAVMSGAGDIRTVTLALGMNTAPVAGDVCFGGQFMQSGYTPQDDGGAVVVSIPFAGWASDSTSLRYAPGFGQLLHAAGNETDVNAAVGVDNLTGAATATGGYMVYHVLSSSNAAHTATLKVQDSGTNADDASFSDITGATTGVITVTAGVSGIVALTPGAAVRRYLRWQVVLGTATGLSFILSFHRG